MRFLITKRINYLVIFLVLLSFIGCVTAPTEFTPEEKVQFTTLKTLKSAKIFRDTALKAASAYYKKGLMDEQMKEKIIKAGDELQNSINIAADALLLYKQSLSKEDEISLEAKIMLYQRVFNQFMELVAPYLITEGE